MPTEVPSSERPSRFARLGLWAAVALAVSAGLSLFALCACQTPR